MEAGKKQFHFESDSLNDIVANVMKSYQSHLESEGMHIILQYAESLPAVQADREALAEAVINILDNAVKYSAADKFLRIATGRSGNMVFVDVEDHGIGIEKIHHQKIFETFYRVSSGLTNNIKGSGLGLSLVNHILQAHNGTIEVQSVPGKGSTFRLLVPMLMPPASQNKG